MNTDPRNQQNSFRAPSHPEQGTDTNPKKRYAVTLHLTRRARAIVTIEASSPEEARDMAGDLEPEDVIGWDDATSDIDVGDVEGLGV